MNISVEADLKELLTQINYKIDKRLEKVEGAQKNQIWALITILGTAVLGFTARLFFFTNL